MFGSGPVRVDDSCLSLTKRRSNGLNHVRLFTQPLAANKLQSTRDGRFRRRCAMARQASSAFAGCVIGPSRPEPWRLSATAHTSIYEQTTDAKTQRDALLSARRRPAGCSRWPHFSHHRHGQFFLSLRWWRPASSVLVRLCRDAAPFRRWRHVSVRLHGGGRPIYGGRAGSSCHGRDQ